MTTIVKKIKAILDFNKVPDSDLLSRLNAVHDSMTGNAEYPNPPVDMATFKTGIDSFSVLITDALDGGKKATSAKRKQRELVITDVTLLGHYVEATCKGDLATFNTSGFVAATKTRNPPQPLPPASIAWVDRGSISGQVLVKVTTLSGAGSYDLRYALSVSGGAPAPWVSLTLTSPKKVTINNLAPGGTYLFQVRALGKLGYTDFSDSITFICA